MFGLIKKHKKASLTCCLLACTLVNAPSALAQEGGLNPDNLSFFEEPLAFNLGGFTITYNQLLDIPVTHNFKNDETDVDPRTNFQVNIERQLPNAITIGATYLGLYDAAEDDEYEDRWAVYASSVWGRLSGGEVNDVVREATRRWRGTGNADLEFDDVLGTLNEDDIGLAYSLRLSAYTLNVGVDDDGHTDLGVTYERPNKYLDFRLTGRYTDSEYLSSTGVLFDTRAVGAVAQVEYGSLAVDAGVGYEELKSGGIKGDRRFISAGIHYKILSLTLSAEGHWGEIEGHSEESYALGAKYDIARGLSLNLGYNYSKSKADIDGVLIQDVDESKFISSLRYEF